MQEENLVESIAQIIERESVGAVVLGDARAFSGAENVVTEEVEHFAHALSERIAIPVYRTREAGSSQEAARFAPKGKKHDDSSAAAIILQRFLDAYSMNRASKSKDE